MKKLNYLFLVILVLGCASCSIGQSGKFILSATDFSAKIKQTPGAVVLDVRTPEEYAEGHLANSLNFNWNDDAFEKQMADIDTSKTVFVYCLAGGRSASAAKYLRSAGFKRMYELSGGMNAWTRAGLAKTKK